MDNLRTFPVEKLQSFGEQAFEKVGVPKEDAQLMTRSLVEADLRNVSTHGVVRLPVYVNRIRDGWIVPVAEPEIVSQSATTAVIDGKNGLGQVVGAQAMDLAIEKAKEANLGAVTVRNSNHFGAAAFYALRALPEDMIGIALSNTPQLMPPTGGAASVVGNNPLSVAIPTKVDPPFVLDMACSAVAMGKLIVASKKGQKIPFGWAVDKEGRPTDDPQEGLAGLLLPVGGPKGFGLALVVEALTSILSQSAMGKEVGGMYKNADRPSRLSHFFLALKIDAFLPVEEFKERMEALRAMVKEVPKAPGVDEIYFTGELEWRAQGENLQNGIQLPPKVVEDLQTLGEELGIEF